MAHPRPDNLPCTFGQYRLESLLGEGGMGCVFVGIKISAEKRGVTMRRAVKVPHDFLLRRDKQFADSFFREARVAEAVQHDNVVRIHDVDVVDGVPFIAMDLLQGGPMDEVLAEQVLEPAHLLDVGIGMAAGLEAIHESNLVHRDIKPANVFLTRQGGVKLLDLGIARLVSGGTSHTRTGTAKGTPGYMAPEQLAAEDIDGRVDLFALGAVLAEAVLGEPVFSAPSLESLIVQMLRSDEIVSENSIVDRVDARVPGLGPVVGRLLEQDPDERTPTARQALRELRQVRRGLPGSLLPDDGLREKVRAWVGGTSTPGMVVAPGEATPAGATPANGDGGTPANGDGGTPADGDGGTFELDAAPAAGPSGTRVLPASDEAGAPATPVADDRPLDKTRQLPPTKRPGAESRPSGRASGAKRGGGIGWVIAGAGGCAALGVLGIMAVVGIPLLRTVADALDDTLDDTGVAVAPPADPDPDPGTDPAEDPPPEPAPSVPITSIGVLTAPVFRSTTGRKDDDKRPIPVPVGALQFGDGGLGTFDLVRGSGPQVGPGDEVVMRYTGWLRDDQTQVDATGGARPTFKYEHDAGVVIEGLDKGLVGMRAGGTRQILIPGAMGYGADGRPGKIPPNADLVFDVDLLSVRKQAPVVVPAVLGRSIDVRDAAREGAKVFERIVGEGDAAGTFSVVGTELTVWNAAGQRAFTTYDQPAPLSVTLVLTQGDSSTRVLRFALEGMKAGGTRIMTLPPKLAGELRPLLDGANIGLGPITVQLDVMTVRSVKIGGTLQSLLGPPPKDQATTFFMPSVGTVTCGEQRVGFVGNVNTPLEATLSVPIGGLGCTLVRQELTVCSGTVFQGKSQCRCDGPNMLCRSFFDDQLLQVGEGR